MTWLHTMNYAVFSTNFVTPREDPPDGAATVAPAHGEEEMFCRRAGRAVLCGGGFGGREAANGRGAPVRPREGCQGDGPAAQAQSGSQAGCAELLPLHLRWRPSARCDASVKGPQAVDSRIRKERGPGGLKGVARLIWVAAAGSCPSAPIHLRILMHVLACTSFPAQRLPFRRSVHLGRRLACGGAASTLPLLQSTPGTPRGT